MERKISRRMCERPSFCSCPNPNDSHPVQLRTAPQSCDQSFDHKLNKTLKASVKTKNPVRVIRGFKLPSVYAPEEGYRYDGLYRVEKVRCGCHIHQHGSSFLRRPGWIRESRGSWYASTRSRFDLLTTANHTSHVILPAISI